MQLIPCGFQECGETLIISGTLNGEVEQEAADAGWMTIIGASCGCVVCPKCIPKAKALLARRADRQHDPSPELAAKQKDA